MQTLALLFWILLALVVYTYVGYGIVLYLLVRLKEWLQPPIQHPLPEEWPPVTLFIAAYNEEAVVDDKMMNTRQLDYPADKLTILWVTDGSNDNTNTRLAAYPDAKVLFDPARKGKTAAMNRGIAWVTTPYVIFSDANTHINPEAIKAIVLAFQDPKVGCVAGEKRVEVAEADNASSGEGFYWKYESTLKRLDGRLAGAAGAAGELFAVRTDLYETMPSDTLLDDFMISLKIVCKGYRTAYCQTAYAMETSSANVQEEEKRKVRIAAGGLQSIARLTPLLNPFRFGLFSFQYVSHRVLRWTVTPVALFLLLPLNLALALHAESPVLYGGLLAGQLLFYLLALWGKILANREVKNKMLFIPYYFLFMNLSVFKGFFYLQKKKNDGTWSRALRKEKS